MSIQFIQTLEIMVILESTCTVPLYMCLRSITMFSLNHYLIIIIYVIDCYLVLVDNISMLVDLILFFIRLDPGAFLLTHNNQSIFLRETFRHNLILI